MQSPINALLSCNKQNKHQYKVTQNKLKDLEQALTELFQIKDTLHPRKFSSRKNGLQIAIDSLREEIEEKELAEKMGASSKR